MVRSIETTNVIEEVLLTAHPDDAEGIFASKLLANVRRSHVVVVTNGDQGIDHESTRAGHCLCPAW